MGDGGNVICCLPERNMAVAIASKFMMKPKDRIKLIKDYILLKRADRIFLIKDRSAPHFKYGKFFLFL
jgi:hypothetical protein